SDSAPRKEIIGHRGYAGRAPENTLASLTAAIEAGADAVEFDIQTASCGTPVLLHDANLGRTTNGVGPVRRRALGQLKKLDAGKWFAPEFEGEEIPSMAQALAALEGRVPRVYAEIKGYRELEDLDRMVTITDAAGMLDTVIFISMDWRMLERVAGRDERVRIGYIVDEAERFAEALDRAVLKEGRALLDFDARLVLADPDLVRATYREGIDVVVWTVNDPADAERLAGAGVYRFTTDEVEALLTWRDGG
ncbi:MAG TPA: glycerophosphodiester phosphodiesterase, partial [Longimicrobiales bacterium]